MHVKVTVTMVVFCTRNKLPINGISLCTVVLCCVVVDSAAKHSCTC